MEVLDKYISKDSNRRKEYEIKIQSILDNVKVGENPSEYLKQWLRTKYAEVYGYYKSYVEKCDPIRTGYRYDEKNNIFRVVDAEKPCSNYVMGLEDSLKLLNKIYDDVNGMIYTDQASKKSSPLDLFLMTNVQDLVNNIVEKFKSMPEPTKTINKKNIIIVVLIVIILMIISISTFIIIKYRKPYINNV